MEEMEPAPAPHEEDILAAAARDGAPSPRGEHPRTSRLGGLPPPPPFLLAPLTAPPRDSSRSPRPSSGRPPLSPSSATSAATTEPRDDTQLRSPRLGSAVAARALAKQTSLNRSARAIRVLHEASDVLRAQADSLSLGEDDVPAPSEAEQAKAVQRFLSSRRLSRQASAASSSGTPTAPAQPRCISMDMQGLPAAGDDTKDAGHSCAEQQAMALGEHVHAPMAPRPPSGVAPAVRPVADEPSLETPPPEPDGGPTDVPVGEVKLTLDVDMDPGSATTGLVRRRAGGRRAA